jgi:hypothetical protein
MIMAPKHDEILKRQADGSTAAWDTNIVARETRKAVDRTVAAQVRELRAILNFGATAQVTRANRGPGASRPSSSA